MSFNFIFSTEKDYKNFVNFLIEVSKSECVNDFERHKKILNTKRKIFCIKMSELKKISNQIFKSDPYGFLKFVKNDSFEEVMIWGLVIAKIKSEDELIKRFDEWSSVIDSWSLCDCVCSSMKLTQKEKTEKLFDYFCGLCFSEKEYVSRLGIVALMTNFLSEQTIDKIYEICEKIKNDSYYVKMAIAWLISVGFLIDRQKTFNFLSKKTLSKFIQNMAISKCNDSFKVSKEDKEKLKKFKI